MGLSRNTGLSVARDYIPVHLCTSKVVRRMASRRGLEPLTPGLGNLYSIQLSYRDPIDRAAAKPYGQGKPKRGKPLA